VRQKAARKPTTTPVPVWPAGAEAGTLWRRPKVSETPETLRTLARRKNGFCWLCDNGFYWLCDAQRAHADAWQAQVEALEKRLEAYTKAIRAQQVAIYKLHAFTPPEFEELLTTASVALRDAGWNEMGVEATARLEEAEGE